MELVHGIDQLFMIENHSSCKDLSCSCLTYVGVEMHVSDLCVLLCTAVPTHAALVASVL